MQPQATMSCRVTISNPRHNSVVTAMRIDHGYARQIQTMLLLQLSLKDIRKRVDHLRSDNQQKRRKLFAAATGRYAIHTCT